MSIYGGSKPARDYRVTLPDWRDGVADCVQRLRS